MAFEAFKVFNPDEGRHVEVTFNKCFTFKPKQKGGLTFIMNYSFDKNPEEEILAFHYFKLFGFFPGFICLKCYIKPDNNYRAFQ